MALALLTRMSMPPNAATGPATGLLDFFGGRVDRARQLRMRLGRLGDDRDVRPVAGSAKRDRQANATTGTGDEERLALEGHNENVVDDEGRRRALAGTVRGVVLASAGRVSAGSVAGRPRPGPPPRRQQPTTCCGPPRPRRRRPAGAQ